MLCSVKSIVEKKQKMGRLLIKELDLFNSRNKAALINLLNFPQKSKNHSMKREEILD
jgi:hypothetical protein